jgi:hypothetical protein
LFRERLLHSLSKTPPLLNRGIPFYAADKIDAFKLKQVAALEDLCNLLHKDRETGHF